MTPHPTPSVAVLGATGIIGSRVASRLRVAGHRVQSATRTPTDSRQVPFDWAVPETWHETLDGTDVLFLLAPDGVDVPPELPGCAAERGVRRVVLLSSMGIETMDDRRLVEAERLVTDGPLDATIVRPNWFDQDFDEGFLRPAVDEGTVPMPLRGVRSGFVDAEDVAAVAVEAITDPGHVGESFEVTGPEALTFDEAVEAIARASGREIRVDDDPARCREAMIAAGRSPEDADAALRSFAALRADPEAAGTRDTVERLLGRHPATFDDYVTRVAAHGAWQ